jgi:hypothetical protein
MWSCFNEILFLTLSIISKVDIGKDGFAFEGIGIWKQLKN